MSTVACTWPEATSQFAGQPPGGPVWVWTLAKAKMAVCFNHPQRDI